PGDWGGFTVWLTFALFLFMPSFAGTMLDRLGFFQTALFDKPPSPARRDIWTAPLALALFIFFLFGVLYAGSRTRPAQIGLSAARWPQNTILGYVVFLALTPIVLGLYFLILLFFREILQMPTATHPLEKLGKEPLTPVEWFLIFVRAPVVAAVMEEVAFRG